MTKKQIAAINDRHVLNVDKYYRMFAGLSSEFIKLEDETLYLNIHVGKRWPKNDVVTASQLANDWVKSNPEIKSAKRYSVSIFRLQGDTGFTLSASEAKNSKRVQSKLDSFKEGIEEMNNDLRSTTIEGPISINN